MTDGNIEKFKVALKDYQHSNDVQESPKRSQISAIIQRFKTQRKNKMSIITKEKAIKNLSKALFSVVSTDPARKALNGIHYDGDRTFEATDGHKMFRLHLYTKGEAEQMWKELVRINPSCNEVCDGEDRLLGKGLAEYVPYPNVKAVVPRITEEFTEDYNFDDELRADMLKSWKLLCPLTDKIPQHLSVWKNERYGAAVRYDKGSCFGWGEYIICTLIMPMRLEDNNAYSKDLAIKYQDELIAQKTSVTDKPAEEPNPEEVQQELY